MALLAKDVWNQKIFIGTWQAVQKSSDVVDVNTNHILGKIGCASNKDIVRAVRHAKLAHKKWDNVSFQDRLVIFERALKIFNDHQNEVIDWLKKERGLSHPNANFEINISIGILKKCIVILEQLTLLLYNIKNLNFEINFNKLNLEKQIVIAVISPFDYALYYALSKVVPALALGHTIILKPDQSATVCSGYTIARIFELAGLPEGVLHVLPGGIDVAEALINDKTITCRHL